MVFVLYNFPDSQNKFSLYDHWDEHMIQVRQILAVHQSIAIVRGMAMWPTGILPSNGEGGKYWFPDYGVGWMEVYSQPCTPSLVVKPSWKTQLMHRAREAAVEPG